MVVDNTQKTSNAIFSTTTKVKEKNTSADEFQATLNEVKNKEEKEEEKTSSSKFTNEDIDLGAVREDFRSYAWQKMREDQYKKNEETLLNKLFATIDAGNATNNTRLNIQIKTQTTQTRIPIILVKFLITLDKMKKFIISSI